MDSHVLYWWLDGLLRLSKPALRAVAAAEGGELTLMVSAVSLWELANKERRGDFAALRPVREWPPILNKAHWLRILPTDPDVWLLAAELDWPHRDPADRIIAATALLHGVPVLTKDRVFHQKNCPVKAVW